MKINNVSNNFARPSFKATENKEPENMTPEEFNSKFEEIKKGRKNAGKTYKINRKNLGEDKALKTYRETLVGLQEELSNLVKRFENSIDPKTGLKYKNVDKAPEFIQTIYRRFSNSWLMKKLSSNGINGNKVGGITIALALGNVLKELMGTTFYTIQAMTNEDLPPDKRKFVGMYDLIVGLVSTSFSIGFGALAIFGQDAAIKWALKNNKTQHHSRYATAYAGLTFLIPNLLQTIIGKRIVAPAIGTPAAGRWKEKQLAKLEAEKAKNNNDVQNKQAESNTVTDLKFTDKGYIDLEAVVEDEKLAKKNTNEKSLATV
ncbi:hypothetical protein J6R97_00945 [bacterium]|nr:hypothetical protein [bacterium]